MSLEDDAEVYMFIGREHLLPEITAEALAIALRGFAPPLAPDKDMNWLALAVRRSLAITVPNASDASAQPSNACVRTELERLAALAGSTWLELFQCDDAADSRLWDHACQHWDGEGASEIGDGIAIGEPSDYRRFKAAVSELDWLAGFMRAAARSVEAQQGPWRLAEDKRLRVERGRYLAPIFEAAFGQPVTANNYPNDARHSTPTAFMDFYQRVVALAFGERATPNISHVVKAACQRHRHDPVHFGIAAAIPGVGGVNLPPK